MKSMVKRAAVLPASLLLAMAVTQFSHALADSSEPAMDMSQMNVPARRLRLRQMLEQRNQGLPLKDGTSPKSESAFAAIDPKKVKVERDLQYGTQPRQDLDVYGPVVSNGPAPVIFFVHGGGWQIGNKTNGHIDKGVAWAEHGVVFVSINYRLAPEVMHPKQIEDVAQAFAWVHKHAAEFGGDPNRIFVMGHSAGAQLVDLLATNGRFMQEQGLSTANIKGVISLDTASLNLQERLGEDSPEAKLVGGMIKSAFGTDPKVLSDASPASSIKPGHSYPPFLMFCGSKRVDCCAQHQRFSAALKKVGGNVTVVSVPLSHADISKAAGLADSEIFKKSQAFMQSSQ